jgi:ribonuclease HI
MWQKKTGQDMKPTFGQILAGGATKFKDPGEIERLYKILIIESAHLIWKLRNERDWGRRASATGEDCKQVAEDCA